MIRRVLVTASLEGDFVVSLIGMRNNRPPFGLGRAGTLQNAFQQANPSLNPTGRKHSRA